MICIYSWQRFKERTVANFVAKLRVKKLARHQRFSKIPSWLNHDATEFMKEMSLATSRGFPVGGTCGFPGLWSIILKSKVRTKSMRITLQIVPLYTSSGTGIFHPKVYTWGDFVKWFLACQSSWIALPGILEAPQWCFMSAFSEVCHVTFCRKQMYFFHFFLIYILRWIL